MNPTRSDHLFRHVLHNTNCCTTIVGFDLLAAKLSQLFGVDRRAVQMSEADSLWYLRHRDGVEHGPFQLADLVTAAQAGNVAADTCVRHEVHTRAQWVFATRVQPIAQGMAREAESSTASAQPRPPQQSNPQPSSQPPSPAQANRIAESSLQASRSEPASIFRGSQPTRAKIEPRNDCPAARAWRSDRQCRLVSSDSQSPLPSHSPFPERLWTRFRHFFLTFDSGVSLPPGSSRSCGRLVFCWPSFRSPSWAMTFLFSHPCHHPVKLRGEATGNSGRCNEQPLLLMRILIFAISALITSVIILCIRVICEMVIVVFLASGDVSELRKLLKQPRP